MDRKIVQKGFAEFCGLSIGKKKTVTLKVKLNYSEMLTSVELLQGLNSDITIHAKIPLEKKALNLGIFTIGGINFDRDGNANVPFNSLIENVNMQNLIQLPEAETIQLKFMAIIELPDNSDSDDKTEEQKDWDE